MKNSRLKKLAHIILGQDMSILCLSAFLSITAFILFSFLGLSVMYNDSMSHENVSRMVVDNLQPGLSQLGGVWLPLNHILSLPLIWNNWAWHSGFAGAFANMVSFVGTIYLLYKTSFLLLKKKLAAIVTASVFAFNANILYLQSTPLTEPLFIFIFTLSFFFFSKWIVRKNPLDLVYFSLSNFFLVLCRYDGWFIVLMELGLILINEIFIEKKKLSSIIGILTVFILPFSYGIALWLIWNKLIFGSFTFFALGPYSAHAQQAAIATKTTLITKSNILTSIKAYGYAAIDNIGLPILFISVAGMALFFVSKKIEKFKTKVILALVLLSPVIFNILALYLGFSILNVPELHWKPSSNSSDVWFNVRYGILALPFVAFFAGYLAQTKKIIAFLCIVIVFSQLFLFVHFGIITITDGVKGSSSFQNSDVASYLKTHVGSKDIVLLSPSYFSPVVFQSNLNFRQIIHEGISKVWSDSLVHPEKYAKWIVMANGRVGDPVYNSLVDSQGKYFLKNYNLMYSGRNTSVYEKKTQADFFIGKAGKEFYQGSSIYALKNLDVNDLAYKSPEEIQNEFLSLKKQRINTVRFFAFGDGSKDGFQPQAGIVNEDRLKNMDYILSAAKKNNLKVIPVLINSGSDYGGVSQYISWVGKNSAEQNIFYSDMNVKNLFKNYVNKVITRKNTITKVEYKDDPTIFEWVVMGDTPQASENGIITSWTKEMTGYIKGLDSNHLIATGPSINVILGIPDQRRDSASAVSFANN